MIPLSETEKAYLLNNEQFSKRKQRYLRYRIAQKLRRRDTAERGNSSRDAATPRASLVRIAPQTWQYESEYNNSKEGMGRTRVERVTPPCQGLEEYNEYDCDARVITSSFITHLRCKAMNNDDLLSTFQKRAK